MVLVVAVPNDNGAALLAGVDENPNERVGAEVVVVDVGAVELSENPVKF